MYQAEFNEYIYGFAMTENFLNTEIPHARRCLPVMPTPREEGSVGGGFDVKIPYRHLSIFLQFKVPQVMSRASRKKPQGYRTPYYRIDLRTKKPNQHKLLMELEAKGNLVFYAAPTFHRNRELREYFRVRTTHHNSVYISPTDIGPLSPKPHHVAYHRGEQVGYVLSKPVMLEQAISDEAFGHTIDHAIRKCGKSTLANHYSRLIHKMVELVSDKIMQFDVHYWDSMPGYQYGGHVLSATLARMVFNCELITIRLYDENDNEASRPSTS